ncbi:MAG: site-specific integrase [Rubrivivax sp.]|nr:site-specific integrase [Rubrivivax sp.]
MNIAISNRVVLSRVPEGPIAPHLGKFADSLSATGYAAQWFHRQVLLAACFSRWLGHKAVSLEDVTSAHLALYLRHRSRSLRLRSGDHGALQHLLDFLRNEGVVPAERHEAAQPSSIDRVVLAYEAHLRDDRALAATTIVNYVPFVRDFLRHRFGADDVKLSHLSAENVVRFVRHEAPRLHRKRAKLMTSALRSFLRYERYCGEVDLDLAAAVPAVPNWSMTSIPRGIAPEKVRQLLASVDRRTASGRRDYAILLLLARLGLRSGEVASVTLDDIDWKTGQLSVHGKSGQRNSLPLSAEVGRAVAAYLENGRPKSSSRSVFLRAKAPVRALRGAGAIGSIVRRSLLRCGIESSTFGAHQFRHGLATQMLRRGASLAEIGDVLGHRNPQTTMIYAKADIQALRELALPWPESAR